MYYMIYKSCHSCSEKVIQEILESSRQHNAEKNITGCLLYSDGIFVQYLEGNRRDLEELYDRIKADERHFEVKEISIGPLRHRLFPTWVMGARCAKVHDFNIIHELEEKAQIEGVLNGPNNLMVLHQIKKLFQ